MAKGYWIARVTVTNPERYKDYVTANAIAFAKYGARFVVRGGQHAVKCGTARARHVVIEFKDYATALACYESPEYKAAELVRNKYSTGDVVVIEGYDG